MIVIIFSIAGLIFFGICNYFFIISDTSRIGKILLGILSLIPFVGAVAYLTFVIIGIFNHYPPYEGFISDGDKLPVRDTKLNRWLFDDIDWERFDEFNSKYNDSKE